MPSDARTNRALEALADQRTRYRSAVSAAHDQMAGYLAAHRVRSQGHAQVAAKELGRFAAGRIDAERFGALFADTHFLSAETTERVERLVGALAELLAEGDELYTCEVPSGGDLRNSVDRALADAGRVFGAVIAFQALKTGVYRPERHDADVAAFPFAKWNRSERLLGLPLVVEVDGANVRAEALTEYLDGRVTIVLVIRGPSSAAPLARLITPGTFVMQTMDVAELASLASCDGPAIVALVSDGAARFVADPRAARSLQSWLRVTHEPTASPTHPLGGMSVWQQSEELALLKTLGTVSTSAAASVAPAPLVAANAGPATTQPAPLDERSVDQLAGWLVDQSGLGAAPIAAGGVGR
jgi:hypothetical protein